MLKVWNTDRKLFVNDFLYQTLLYLGTLTPFPRLKNPKKPMNVMRLQKKIFNSLFEASGPDKMERTGE